ncbi:serine hydrolase domain-containing protein [Winogradskyella helgolandensis]|uniref:serine hydrolase domain-containing protein n=1 Tax=Winogradskyella helgolandensis TaxID=2697010 RepID=UPI0015CA37A0|nr:serine hydrolase domain-containing protein [Winogradskyella helgolandensis]
MKLLIWTFLLFTNILIAQTNEKFQTESLTKELTELSNKNSIVGFSVAIVNRDSILFAKGFGYSDKEKKILYTKNTVQPIASISKTLAGVALMKAQELGKLNLEDDINIYLPFKIVNPYFPNSKITIRNIATHSSGLKDSRNYSKTMIVKDFCSLPKKTRKYLSNNWCRKCEDNKDIPMVDFIENIYSSQGDWYKKRHFLKEPTGTKYNYTNNNTTIVAYIIEQVTGEKYNDFIKKHITQPLNMTSSNWVFEGSISENISTLYANDIPMPEMNDITYPDGSFVTNVVDFGNYLSTMINGYSGKNNILNSESYNEMMSQQINPEFESGIFWEVYSKSIGHSGEHAGTSTYAYFDKENLVGYILFGNTTDTKELQKEEIEIISVLKKYSTE